MEMSKVPTASQMAMGNMSGPRAGRGVPEESGWAEPGRRPSRRTARMRCARAVPAESVATPRREALFLEWEGGEEEGKGARRL